MKEIDTDKRPFVLIWEVTQACDLTCEHCRADAQPERHPDELTTEEGFKLLEEAVEFGQGQIVVLSGGDPLKRDDIFDFVEHGTDIGLRMTMTPSGTNSLTHDAIERLKDSGLRRIALSIDGAGQKLHDAFRGEEGSFDQTIRAAKNSRDADIPLQINTTVCQQTVDQLPEIRELVSELGAVLWSVFFLVPVGRGAVLDQITPERAEEVMEWLHDVNSESDFGIKTTEAPHFRRVGVQQRQESGQRGDKASSEPTSTSDRIGRRTGITAGDGFAFVSHTGEIFPSGFLPASAGNVRDESLVNVYRNSEMFKSLRDKDNLKGKCGECEYRNLCGGSRSRAYATTGDVLESDPLCSYVPDGYDGTLPSTHESVDT